MNEKRLLKLKNPEYRRAFLETHCRVGMTHQLRALRRQRGWTQGDLAERAGKKQNVISRLEDPEYSKMSIQTALELADAFGAALIFKIVPWSRFLKEVEDLSPDSLGAESFDTEIDRLIAESRSTADSANRVVPGNSASTSSRAPRYKVAPPTGQLAFPGFLGESSRNVLAGVTTANTSSENRPLSTDSAAEGTLSFARTRTDAGSTLNTRFARAI